MNLPNQITIFRIFLAPVFLLLLLLPIPHSYFWAAAVFGLAGVSDSLDGYLARRNKQVTTFGKLMDPVADKLLTTAALLAFMRFGWCDVWLVLLVLAREFLVTSVRMVASAQGVVIPANVWGKVKTVSQVITTLLILLLAEAARGFEGLSWFRDTAHFGLVSGALLWVTAILAVASGVIYVWDAAKVIKFNMK